MRPGQITTASNKLCIVGARCMEYEGQEDNMAPGPPMRLEAMLKLHVAGGRNGDAWRRFSMPGH